MTTKPLSAITVLDLTNVLAGPYCCHQLALMGARVIKVEAVGRGDLARNLGADEVLNSQGMGVSFLAQNAGKQSVTLNLKHHRGRKLLKQLVSRADVLVENFRPGVMARLELDYSVLKEINPKLIYCAISGFGQSGPWVERPAYDQIIQGISGVMSITGDDNSAPLRVGYPIADTVGGMTAAFAITAALNANPRGTMIDVSMLESVLSTMGWVVSNYLVAGVQPAANGNENVTSAPSGAFRTRDGLLNIAANKEEQWRLLCQQLDRPDLLQRPEFATRTDRKANRAALRQALEETLQSRPAAEWADTLNRVGVPAGAVLTVPEVLASDQIDARGFLQSFPAAPQLDREIMLATGGMILDGNRPKFEQPPPGLGADSDEIWRELGLTAEQIGELKDEGVV